MGIRTGIGEKEACVLVFIRAPELGKVKTRLARELGDDTVLKLYKAFVRDTLRMLQENELAARLYYYPASARDLVIQWLGGGYRIVAQEGRDLGEKMYLAFADAFQAGFGKAVLIGTDIPDLPGGIIRDGIMMLDNYDAVIGPSTDGGYYLAGFRHDTLTPDVFEDIQWGNETVFENTLIRFKRKNLSWKVLPRWRDIDNLADLERLMETLADNEKAARHTRACLNESGHEITRKTQNINGLSFMLR